MSENKIQDAICQACAFDGDEYHAHINRYPVGTTFRCTRCVRLFGGLVEPKVWEEADSPSMRAAIGSVIMFLVFCLLVILFMAFAAPRQAKADEINEYYQFQMRAYRYGTITNQVWAKLHFEYATNIIQHGNIKRELVYLLEVAEIEGRTNTYVLHSEFVSDTISK